VKGLDILAFPAQNVFWAGGTDDTAVLATFCAAMKLEAITPNDRAHPNA
jgi:hypothetical protein